MSDFKDYDIRVWGGSVFITSPDMMYSYVRPYENLQCNFDNTSLEYEQIMKLSSEIKERMLKLDELLKQK